MSLKHHRSFVLLMLLLWGSLGSWSQDGFDPVDPPEPGLPPMRLEVTVNPGEAGSVSGAGSYVEGTKVNLQAYVNTGFNFVNWTNNAGEVLSTSTSFTYTKGEGHERLWANYEFDPDNPAEPVEPQEIQYFRLTLQATEGGSVSGGGSYLAGKQVTLRASTESQFDFDGWYTLAGEKLSSSPSFSYTTTPHHVTLEGRFTFNPDNPVEPTASTLRPKHMLTATCTDGGTISWTTKRLMEGESVVLEASANSGYDFDGWYKNGELFTSLLRFSYTVTDEDVQAFEARFTFNPGNPAEPSEPSETKHAFFVLNKVTSPGTSITFPVYLSNVRPLRDMTFQLTFPRQLLPDTDHTILSDRVAGYTFSCTKGDESDNEVTYVISLIGGEVAVGNAALLTFNIDVPENIATAENYPVRINQVSVGELGDDGVTVTDVTAATRNGRISVYKLGDSNGDDDINVADLTGLALFLIDKPEENLIFYAADMNGNEVIEDVDYEVLVDSVLSQLTPASVASSRRPLPAKEVRNKLIIPEQVSAFPGNDVIMLPIELENADGITGFQFDMHLARGVEVSTDENGDYVIDMMRSDGGHHRLDTRVLYDGSVRVICSSMKSSCIRGSSGSVLVLRLRIKNGHDVMGASIGIDNIVLTDTHAMPYYADGVRTVITDGSGDEFSVIDYELVTGWNWLSTNLAEATQRDSRTFISDIEGDVERLISQTEELVNDPLYGLVGNLSVLEPMAAYKLKMAQGAQMRQTGKAVPLAMVVSLRKGWNWLGYLPTVALPVQSAFAQSSPSTGDRLLCRDGFAEYDGTTWQGNFLMQPGQGYMYFANHDMAFVYNSASNASQVAAPFIYSQGQTSSPWDALGETLEYDAYRYPDNMTMVAEIVGLPDHSSFQQSRFAVGAFVDNVCRGVGRWIDERLFLTVHGESGGGEVVTLRAFDLLTGEVYAIAEAYGFDAQCLGSLSRPVQLHVVGQTAHHSSSVLHHQVTAVYSPSGYRLQHLQRGVNILVDALGSSIIVISK